MGSVSTLCAFYDLYSQPLERCPCWCWLHTSADLCCSTRTLTPIHTCVCAAGIAPDWDDPQIQHGGLWLAHSSDVIAREDAQHSGYTLHDAWMDTVMHAIGEQIPDSNHVAGVALNIRKNGSRLALWTRGAKSELAEKVVGRDFKSILRMPAQRQVGYSSFNDSKAACAEGKMFWSGFKGSLRV